MFSVVCSASHIRHGSHHELCVLAVRHTFQCGFGIMQASVEYAKQMRYCGRGDCIVALHRIGNASVIKIVDIKN